jgi:hypothetical protein
MSLLRFPKTCVFMRTFIRCHVVLLTGSHSSMLLEQYC